MLPRIIKKYGNRRLYDTLHNNYITLADVKILVLEQVPIQIIDAKSKKDLTQMTLMQIISEEEINKTPIFTIEMLQDFIRFYHQKSQHLFTNYLQQAMNLFLEQRELFSNQLTSYQKLLLTPLATTSNSPKIKKTAKKMTSKPLTKKPAKKTAKRSSFKRAKK